MRNCIKQHTMFVLSTWIRKRLKVNKRGSKEDQPNLSQVSNIQRHQTYIEPMTSYYMAVK